VNFIKILFRDNTKTVYIQGLYSLPCYTSNCWTPRSYVCHDLLTYC